jgi:predicted enzyme related to lactoylglutathione lyase
MTMLGYYAIHAPDTARAKDFYTAVFGWTYDSRGDYHHIAGSSPAGGITPGDPRIEPSFVVPDAAAAVAQARESGSATPPKKSDSGWSFEVEDGHGGRLSLWQPADGYHGEPKCGDGDALYFVQPVANDAALEFWTALLGWELTPGSHERGWNIVNVNPHGGVLVGEPGPTDVYFHVADVDAAAEKIRAAGGSAGPAQPNQVGAHAICRDDQGITFGLASIHQK